MKNYYLFWQKTKKKSSYGGIQGLKNKRVSRLRRRTVTIFKHLIVVAKGPHTTSRINHLAVYWQREKQNHPLLLVYTPIFYIYHAYFPCPCLLPFVSFVLLDEIFVLSVNEYSFLRIMTRGTIIGRKGHMHIYYI